MSRIVQQGRHTIIFADREGITPAENDHHIRQFWMNVYNKNINQGAVQSDGTILWDCPCLGTQAIGPCSTQFRAAFSCYQNSTNKPKGNADLCGAIATLDYSGSECMTEMMRMHDCFAHYPNLYKEKSSEKENETKLGGKLMTHPEARRYRMNEAKKQKNQ